MSEMVHYIITNKKVLMEQYANDKGPGRGGGGGSGRQSLPEALGCLMEAANQPAF